MEKIPVRVYTDYKSPYAFVAKNPTYELAEKYHLELDWYPYTLRIPEYLGSLETRNEHQWRRVRYSYMDARRLANKQGLVLKGPEKIYIGYYANAGLLFAKQHGLFRAYNDTTFERFWRRELDIDSLDAMAALISDIGGDAAAFSEYAEGQGRADHERVITEAEGMGVFGVPMFVLDGELFWGGDRMDMLVERITERRTSQKGAV
jgi:2-hydroxychromene-2-carboxylate isomerase